MNQELATLITEIDANVSHAETITHALSDAQFNWSPAPGRWSMAQCFMHLNVANSTEIPVISAGIARGRERKITGEGPFTYGLLSRKLVASQDLPVKKKFKAPKLYVPPPHAGLDQTLAEYRRISAEFRRIAFTADGLDLARVKCVLPVLPALLRWLIRMPLGARFALLTTHDRRHLWQAEQVRHESNFPAA